MTAFPLRRTLVLLLSSAVALAAIPALLAQTRGVNRQKYIIHVRRAEVPVSVDGVLDDAAWEGAEIARNFQRVTPVDKGFSRAQTEVKVAYDDDIWVGYRHFATKGVKTAYPFGFGLSYTSFRYSGLRLSGTEFKGELTATVTVANAGAAAGREVVELYLSAPGKVAVKPALELRGFAKTRLLKPGESQSLTFTLTARDLASFDEASSSWLAEAGRYTVKVGASSEDIRQTATFTKAREEKLATVSTAVGPGK